ncbi:MAG: phytanoyl-CoA dioxygenase family protein [Acidimicrobiales bacterium]|jgi:ectoine hydroxylase-related dioxygenase (phytanoyl-CoA dioxygenase family)|nr:phytanoyl-CoA dioxygenase family protein [Acidimicrobiales bacterium]MDP6298574.1 phytanoyl-CoA dioxygenase family protein [Acidimicrobiales bacterium]HJM29117.1 phytanoyl-CoA dioxygenase family protein [Acidimicrobiales bacterium]HJM97433.1 phytanoyl-CoA dioxygenase family protein [Acidimicrobiales bacterium]
MDFPGSTGLNGNPLREISDSECDAYKTDGVVCLRSVFDSGWVDWLRDAFALALQTPGPLSEEYTPVGKTGRFFTDLNMWQRLDHFKVFVFESPAAKVAQKIIGTVDINFFYDQMFIKHQRTEERTPWHQDQPYWAVTGQQVCSIWLPLDAIEEDSSLKFIKGSHRWAAHNPHHFADDTPYEETGLPELPDIENNLDIYETISWDVNPGDCLVFHGMIVHGSYGNSSSKLSRRALATRWCGDDVRFFRRKGEVAIPTTDPGLKNGDRLDCDLFPRIELD